MAMKTEVYGETLGDGIFFRSGSIGDRCKEQVMLTQDAAVYASGTVLTVAGDKMVRFDGTGDAAGILLLGVDAIAGDERGTAIVRDATFVDEALVFAAGVTDPQKATAIAKLAESGLVGRHYSESTTPAGGA